ncbi:MAG: DUF3857 domain-containing protein [Candidatus Krumholzibacteriota bacterium]
MGRCSLGMPGFPARTLRTLSFALILLACTPVLEGLAGTGTLSPGTSSGWDQLFENRFKSAETEFRQALEADDEDFKARQGLIVALLCLGKDDELLAQVAEMAREPSLDPNDLLLLAFMTRHTGLSSQDYFEALLEYAKRSSKEKSVGVLDRRLYRNLALDYAAQAGLSDEVAELGTALGRVTRWAVLGPFDNTSGSGHQRRYIQSFLPDDRKHIGKMGQSLQWFFPELIGVDGTLTPANHFYHKQDITAYARTVVDVPRDGTYLVSLAYEGDVQLLVDDVTIHDERKGRTAKENLHWHVKLAAGAHEIIAKISSREAPGRFAFSITETDGTLIKDLKVDPGSSTDRDMAARPVFESRTPQVFWKFLSQKTGSTANREADFWKVYFSFWDQSPEADQTFQTLVNRHRGSALIMLAAADALGMQGRTAEARQHIERACRIHSDLAPAVLARAESHMTNGRYDLAGDLADGILRTAPDCRQALWIKYQCLEKDLRFADLGREAAHAAERFPDEPLGYHYQAIAAASLGESRKAADYRDKALKLFPPGSTHFQQAMQSIDEAGLKKSRGRLKDLAEKLPDQEFLWNAYLHSLTAAEKIDDTIDVLNRLAPSFPQSLDFLSLKGLIAEAGYFVDESRFKNFWLGMEIDLTEAEFARMYPVSPRPESHRVRFEHGVTLEKFIKIWAKENAARHFEAALAVAPGNFEVRNKVQMLKGKSDLRNYLPDVDPDGLPPLRCRPEDRPDDDAVIIKDWRRRFVYDENASIADRIVVVQVLNQAGIEKWESQLVPFSTYLNRMTVVSAMTIKTDGTFIDAETAGPAVLFPRLEPGDVTFFHYRVITYHTGHLAGQFWDHHVFAYEDPCLNSRFTLVYPRSMSPLFQVLNDPEDFFVMKNEAILDEDYRTIRWSSRSNPVLVKEPLSAQPRAHRPWVDVSTIDSWSTISRWYNDIADGQAVITPEVETKAKEITRDCADDPARYRAICDFVANRISYQFTPLLNSALVPRSSDETLETGYGDCKDKSTLMLAMLRAVGIESAGLALTFVNHDGGAQFLPSPRFNHAIVGAGHGDGPVSWYDPTVAYGVPGRIPVSLIGSPVLRIDNNDERDIQTIGHPEPEDCVSDTWIKLSLDAQGAARAAQSVTYRSADEVASIRSFDEGSSRTEFENVVLVKMAGRYPGAQLDSVSITTPEDRDDQVTVTSAFLIPDCFLSNGGMMTGSIPVFDDFISDLGSVVALTERTQPLDLRFLTSNRRAVLELELPPGFELLSVPEDLSSECDGFFYEATYRLSERTLVVERELMIAGTVTDVQAYPDLKEAMDRAVKDLKGMLILGPATGRR